jgi:hypothetical protein
VINLGPIPGERCPAIMNQPVGVRLFPDTLLADATYLNAVDVGDHSKRGLDKYTACRCALTSGR